jgi:hypothetical protein
LPTVAAPSSRSAAAAAFSGLAAAALSSSATAATFTGLAAAAFRSSPATAALSGSATRASHTAAIEASIERPTRIEARIEPRIQSRPCIEARIIKARVEAHPRIFLAARHVGLQIVRRTVLVLVAAILRFIAIGEDRQTSDSVLCDRVAA